MRADYIGLLALEVRRELAALPEVETQIKSLGSTKTFVEKFQNNKEHEEACRKYVQPAINQA